MNKWFHGLNVLLSCDPYVCVCVCSCHLNVILMAIEIEFHLINVCMLFALVYLDERKNQEIFVGEAYFNWDRKFSICVTIFFRLIFCSILMFSVKYAHQKALLLHAVFVCCVMSGVHVIIMGEKMKPLIFLPFFLSLTLVCLFPSFMLFS